MKLGKWLKDFLNAKKLERIKNKYKKEGSNFIIDSLSERELRCLMKYDVLRPNKFNKYDPMNDIEFLIETKRSKNLSTAQIIKKHILTSNITNYLKENTG